MKKYLLSRIQLGCLLKKLGSNMKNKKSPVPVGISDKLSYLPDLLSATGGTTVSSRTLTSIPHSGSDVTLDVNGSKEIYIQL